MSTLNAAQVKFNTSTYAARSIYAQRSIDFKGRYCSWLCFLAPDGIDKPETAEVFREQFGQRLLMQALHLFFGSANPLLQERLEQGKDAAYIIEVALVRRCT